MTRSITVTEACLRGGHIFLLGSLEKLGIHRATDVETALCRLERKANDERSRRDALEDFDAERLMSCLLTINALTRIKGN